MNSETTYNIYCDESCHLEHDNQPVMVLGAVWCPQKSIKRINGSIKQIKAQHGISPLTELKWTKVSLLYKPLYEKIVDRFFDEEDLHFRCLVADKTRLDHQRYDQTHDDWYYKMYFDMLRVIFSPKDNYEVYTDIKDTHSFRKTQKLHDVCCNAKYDFSKEIITKIQPVRSEEVQIMQITDILTGAVSYRSRFPELIAEDHPLSAKSQIVNRVIKRSGYSLGKTTLYREDKFNIFMWEPDFQR